MVQACVYSCQQYRGTAGFGEFGESWNSDIFCHSMISNTNLQPKKLVQHAPISVPQAQKLVSIDSYSGTMAFTPLQWSYPTRRAELGIMFYGQIGSEC